jgi:phosphoribosylamine---glycine ligase
LKLLVIGSGGREHTIVRKLKESAKVDKIFWAPGNGGCEGYAEAVPISSDDIEILVSFAKEKKIDFVVVGPEAPLANGIVNRLEESGIKAFGPRKEAAILESSKVFTKEFCKRNNIPTGGFDVFADRDKALDHLKSGRVSFPAVIKADGLSAGKGVIIARTFEEAEGAVNKIMVDKEFGEAGSQLIVEEFLTGEEASVMALCDGKNSLLLPTARDYKRVFDGDKGPNTGGMGAISPAPILSGESLREIKEKIIDRTLFNMAKEGAAFKGVLYAGIMMTEKGPQLLEFNVRFGDPETQVVLPRLEEDLLDLLMESSSGNLSGRTMKVSPRPAVTVVATSKGYPGKYQKGCEITGIKNAEEQGAIVFHAGTKTIDGKTVTDGGRVLNVTSLGSTVAGARDKAYRALSFIGFHGISYRNDIAQRAKERL